ncbi:HI0074 family nucleotidyltransferase substrate-binding subunit [Nitratiruptor sp. SB155-2]|uniref:HI0074 family nucleotidyltransferase substrate-binding subunit n=1 Tax=Nitratiruptor sp. (strain SB155-2) TaxID=387092 RepID=UPI0001586F18|nr:HI0074 family nucleotidyltransferase substrate-binding subunit [Nitratiruptor sp. SB155-2]BAF69254.1 nucleotidyltransferase, substrate-binding protein [Nitratiruptor sp. SB155-2]
MKKSDVLVKIKNFEMARQRLQEAVDIAQDELDKDGVLQRFEFTVEMLWKALKAVLTYQGIECFSPRSCIKEAYKAHIIDDDEIVLDMLEDRNLSSHIYDQKRSEEIFERIKKIYLLYLKNLELKKWI